MRLRSALHNLAPVWRACRFNDTSFALVLARYLWHRLRGRNILAGPRAKIRGSRNIRVAGLLKVGLSEVGFVDGEDRSLVRVRGKLVVGGRFSIAQGCRIDVGPNAVVELGSGYINPFTKVIVSSRLTVGDGCAISWRCQIIDDDFHCMQDGGAIADAGATAKPVIIGDHVWIGAGVIVLKGAVIPSGCVVAAGAVVRSAFDEENCLIGGVPARVLRRGVRWA